MFENRIELFNKFFYTDLVDTYCINFNNIRFFSPTSPELHNVVNELNKIKNSYNNIIIQCDEEFYFKENWPVEFIIRNSLKIGFKIFIYSFNSNVNDFLKVKFPNEYQNKLIAANLPATLCKLDSAPLSGWQKLEYTKDINLLFLNYNRKINRDLIITMLKNNNQLFNPNNFISYHNFHTFDENRYYKIYNDYAEKNGINFEYLKTLKLEPELVDIHQQNDAQQKAQMLHVRTKFNIICEPFFGLNDDINSFEYFNHTLSRKTIYPILYRNVIYVHGHNDIFKNTLKELGFEVFFDNFDEFINNMTDEFYYSADTQKKLDNNQKLMEYLSGLNLQQRSEAPNNILLKKQIYDLFYPK